jgi:DNA (cytosine-5)-methyltransferase 1
MDKIRIIDLFAGIGGIRLGFEAAGAECVFSSEIDEDCRKVYERNFGEIPHGDITKIDPSTIPDHEILTAGFPCQPFSICGKKRGFEDTRGTLFFNICEIIQAKSPSVILLENVKYLIHHDNGNTLRVIIQTLEDMDYYVSYKLLNAINFGLPQNRERILIIASKNSKFDFFRLKMSYDFIKLKDFLVTDENFEYLDEKEYTLLENIKRQPSGLIFIGYRNKNIWKTGIRPNTEHLSRVHRQPNRIYSDEGTHPTIPSQETSGRFFIYLSDEKKVRKLTLKECYKIMGFPDNFQPHELKASSYKQIGNSVCVPMITEVAKTIIKQNILEKNYAISREVKRNIPQQAKLRFI